MDFSSLFFNKYVLGTLAAAIIIGGLAIAHSHYVDGLVDAAVTAEAAKWQTAIDKQKAEAQAKLESIIAANAEKERTYIERLNTLEGDYAKAKDEVAKRNAELRATHGKLQDIARKGSGDCGISAKGTTPPNAGVGQGGASDKNLSPELENLLWADFDAGDTQVIQYERLQKYTVNLYQICQGG